MASAQRLVRKCHQHGPRFRDRRGAQRHDRCPVHLRQADLDQPRRKSARIRDVDPHENAFIGRSEHGNDRLGVVGSRCDHRSDHHPAPPTPDAAIAGDDAGPFDHDGICHSKQRVEQQPAIHARRGRVDRVDRSPVGSRGSAHRHRGIDGGNLVQHRLMLGDEAATRKAQLCIKRFAILGADQRDPPPCRV